MSTEPDHGLAPGLSYHLLCVLEEDGHRNVLTTRTPVQWLADRRVDEQLEAMAPGPGTRATGFPPYRGLGWVTDPLARPIRRRATLIASWEITEADAQRLCDADPVAANALRMEEHARRFMGRGSR